MAATVNTVGLDLYITGTCLIVPNRRKKHVAVLMPQTTNVGCAHTPGGGHGGHVKHVDPHQSVLAIPQGHVDASECTKQLDGWCIIDLSRWHLRVHNGSDPEYDLGTVHRLDRASNRRARSTFGSELQARVDLASGRLLETPQGKRFRIDGAKVHMPHYLKWGIDDCAPVLRLTCMGCGMNRDIQLQAAGQARIEILVQNVPPDEIGPEKETYTKPSPNTSMHHFLALDQLLEPGHDPLEAPVWEDKQGDDVSIATARGGNPYTCMPGGTGPGDDGP